MHTCPDAVFLHVATYLCPSDVRACCATRGHWRVVLASLRWSDAVPRQLLRLLGVATTSKVHAKAAALRLAVRAEPAVLIDLWKDIAERLWTWPAQRRPVCQHSRMIPVNIYRVPFWVTLNVARQTSTWQQNNNSVVHRDQIIRVRVHDTYRLPVTHVRVWRRHAFTALALIF